MSAAARGLRGRGLDEVRYALASTDTSANATPVWPCPPRSPSGRASWGAHDRTAARVSDGHDCPWLSRSATPLGVPVGVHLRNTRNTGFANALAAIDAGATALDPSTGGVGGCPFFPDGTGNIATEDLIYPPDGEGNRDGRQPRRPDRSGALAGKRTRSPARRPRTPVAGIRVYERVTAGGPCHLLGEVSPVNHQGVTGDKSGCVGGQPHDGGGHVIGTT